MRVARGRWRANSRVREGWCRREVKMLKGGFSDGGGGGSPKLRRLSGVTGGMRAGSWSARRGLLVGERSEGGCMRGRLAGEGLLGEVLDGLRPW